MSKIFSNRIIDGNALAKTILAHLKSQISGAKNPPKLSILLAG